MKQFYLLVILFFSATILSAQNHYKRFESIDVLHYSFEIHLNDSTDRIEGKTTIRLKMLKPLQSVLLDFVSKDDSTIYGMHVNSIQLKNKPLSYSHQTNQLKIALGKKLEANIIIDITIEYDGIPADGLIISKNKFDDRTFFGDNWPDRARNWLPTVDHPSDKATLEFQVFAPEQYKVVSNGYLLEESSIQNNYKFTHWKEDVPLSTKLMVIGVARFAVQNNLDNKEIPISSWVFPQNRENGFYDYQYGAKALNFFSELIGPYSYEKLAHVQSKTRYGGMENASCIFYSERSVNGKNQQERLFAHEVAHQWFGNSVSEQNWHHVWLSEGFATYLTQVYKQHFYGEEVFREGLKTDREKIIKYAKRNLAPIIDTSVTNYIRLLNTNSYQKASWFLHMLCVNLGDDVFFEGLRKYYSDFQNSTALTTDFINAMEFISEKDLDLFFEQWLWQKGHPVLNLAWGRQGEKAHVSVIQSQSGYFFNFPFEIKILYEDGSSKLKILEILKTGNEQRFPLQNGSKIERIIFDPNVKLLFEFAGKNY